MRQIVLAALFFVTITGCASVTVQPVANSFGSKGATLKADETGVRFYRPALYVWITRTQPSDKVNVTTVQDKKGDRTTTSTTSLDTEPGYSATVVVLPDLSQEYIIQWNAGMGSVNPHFELSDGWNLKAFDSKVETKTAENITAVTGTITSIGKLAAGGLLAKSSDFKGAGLYRVKVAPGTGALSLGELVLGLE
jgi:hypothetical protein